MSSWRLPTMKGNLINQIYEHTDILLLFIKEMRLKWYLKRIYYKTMRNWKNVKGNQVRYIRRTDFS